ncbi:MAG TPA: M15 family metallopeptidase [Acholeplasmataceae bacterium]|nr:M15 family metallopeptidase [Acholeplasmataceae bacterium]
MRKKYRFFLISILITIVLLTVSLVKEKQRQKQIEELSRYLNEEEIAFAITNNIMFSDLQDFLEYDNFIIFYYRSYQRLKEDYSLTPLEAINLFHNPNYYSFYKNPKPALFLETPLVLVNKCYYLEKDFVPEGLVLIDDYKLPHYDRPGDEIRLKKIVLEKLKLMFEEAKSNDHSFVVYSGYRNYQKQEYLYYEVYGENDALSARPGFSEHQTGYAVDISTATAGLTRHFEKTAAFKWLKENAYRFGFILRFPKGKEHLTGYEYEPWHFRYVGIHATEIHLKEITLEEYILANFEL